MPGNKISVDATVFRKTGKCGPWVCLSLAEVGQEESVKSSALHRALLYHPSLS